MIFHHPVPVGSWSFSGSGVRPGALLQAFRDLGYEVEEVTGYGPERPDRRSPTTAPRWLEDDARLRVRRVVDDAQRIDGPRSPSATPAGRCDVLSRHAAPRRARRSLLSRHPLAVRRVPIRHHLGQANGGPGLLPLGPAHLPRTVDVLFLPSVAMASVIPGAHRLPRIEALPPGGMAARATRSGSQADEPFRVLYVGGVVPPLYDLRDVLDVVARHPDVHLTICCREFEAHALGEAPENCVVVHEEGAALVRPLRDCRHRACGVRAAPVPRLRHSGQDLRSCWPWSADHRQRRYRGRRARDDARPRSLCRRYDRTRVSTGIVHSGSRTPGLVARWCRGCGSGAHLEGTGPTGGGDATRRLTTRRASALRWAKPRRRGLEPLRPSNAVGREPGGHRRPHARRGSLRYPAP